jgi:XRE family transcriptional regulator, stress-response regulator
VEKLMGEKVGTYIRQLRQQRQISIRSLGGQVGVSPAYLSLIERGKREAAVHVLYPIVDSLNGDFAHVLRLLAMDAGVPEGALPPGTSNSDKACPNSASSSS